MSWADSDRAARLPPDWHLIRHQVLSEADWMCEIGWRGCLIEATEVDHKRRGDDHARDNLRAACSWCHGKKTAAEGVARRRELRARRKRPQERPPGRR